MRFILDLLSILSLAIFSTSAFCTAKQSEKWTSSSQSDFDNIVDLVKKDDFRPKIKFASTRKTLEEVEMDDSDYGIQQSAKSVLRSLKDRYEEWKKCD